MPYKALRGLIRPLGALRALYFPPDFPLLAATMDSKSAKVPLEPREELKDSLKISSKRLFKGSGRRSFRALGLVGS